MGCSVLRPESQDRGGGDLIAFEFVWQVLDLLVDLAGSTLGPVSVPGMTALSVSGVACVLLYICAFVRL